MPRRSAPPAGRADGRSLVLLAAVLASCSPASGMATTSFHVESSAFRADQPIPPHYTCSGDDASPPLRWSGVPQGTRSLALIVDDPDAPSGLFTHWLVWNIPPETGGFGENAPAGTAQGKNDFGRTGWGGPCPPPGKPHHYRFKLLALDRSLELGQGAGRAELDRALKGHVLGEATLTGTYGRARA